MDIAIISNGNIGRIGHYRKLFPHTVFPDTGPTAEWLAANSCKKVNTFKAHDQDTEVLVSASPYVEGDYVYLVAVRSKTTEEVQQTQESKAAQLRAQRNALLAQTDWTQVADSQVDKDAWAAYRQELRDISAQETFPDSVTWPTSPDTPTE